MLDNDDLTFMDAAATTTGGHQKHAESEDGTEDAVRPAHAFFST